MMSVVFAKKRDNVLWSGMPFFQPNIVRMGSSNRNNSASLNLLAPKITLTKKDSTYSKWFAPALEPGL